MAIKIFVDSDVVISSLLSSSGAAYLLLNSIDDIELIVSNYSLQELDRVTDRLNIEKQKLHDLSKERLQIKKISEDLETLKLNFLEYVLDIDDTHIIAGAVNSKTTFLITYNIRHFKLEKIKQDFNIIVLTPAMFIQYLRSK